MTNYDRGAAFERMVMADFQKHGYTAIRAAGSHTPADVYAFRKGKPNIFVQCKRNGRLDPFEWNEFLHYCDDSGALPIMAEKPLRGIKYHLIVDFKTERGAQPMRDWVIE